MTATVHKYDRNQLFCVFEGTQSCIRQQNPVSLGQSAHMQPQLARDVWKYICHLRSFRKLPSAPAAVIMTRLFLCMALLPGGLSLLTRLDKTRLCFGTDQRWWHYRMSLFLFRQLLVPECRLQGPLFLLHRAVTALAALVRTMRICDRRSRSTLVHLSCLCFTSVYSSGNNISFVVPEISKLTRWRFRHASNAGCSLYCRPGATAFSRPS